MTQYIRVLSNDIIYPYSPERLRADNPQVSYPKDISISLLNEYDVFEVEEVAQPAYNAITQDLFEDPPLLVENIWTQQWRIETVSTEIAETRLNNWRSDLIVSPRQARLALNSVGLLSTVEAWIYTSDDNTKIDWEFATEIRRDWPPITACAISLGLSDLDIDNLFLTAATL